MALFTQSGQTALQRALFKLKLMTTTCRLLTHHVHFIRVAHRNIVSVSSKDLFCQLYSPGKIENAHCLSEIFHFTLNNKNMF